MKMAFNHVAKLTGALAGGLMLAGCVSFGSEPPPQLLSLRSAAAVESSPQVAARATKAIVLIDLETPRKLQTQRVPVQVDDTAVAYVKDAMWVDNPRDMFRRLLSERLAGKAQMLVLDDSEMASGDAPRLSGQLMDFGVDARSNSARVRFIATLSDANGKALFRRDFAATAPVRKIKADSIALPIDMAAQDVAEQVADWIAGMN